MLILSPRTEVLAVAALLVVLLSLSTLWLVQNRSAIRLLPPRLMGGLVALFVLAALLALFVAKPALIHGSIDHAAFLVESILDFPSRSPHRAQEYGYGCFATLGLAVAVFGRRVETIVAANALISALCVFPIAVVAARWSGRRNAALYGAAAWAASPLVARVAHSEDAHVVGVAYGLFGLAWLEVGLAKRSRLALLNGAIAAALAAMSRQTLYPWIPLCCAVLLERWWRERARPTPEGVTGERIGFAAVALTIVAMCLPVLRGVLAMAAKPSGGGSNEFILLVYEHIFTVPRTFLKTFGLHPLFDIHSLSVLVPTIGLLGAVTLCSRGSPIRLAYPAAFFTLLLVTLPYTLPVPGDRWVFRFPLYALAIITVGVGAARVEAWLERRATPPRARLLAPGLTAAVALLALCCRATLDDMRPDAAFLGYQFLRDAVESRPGPMTIVGFGPAEAMTYRRGVRFAGTPSAVKDITGPWIFAEGPECQVHAYDVLLWPDRTERLQHDAMLRAWLSSDELAHDGDRIDLVDPAGHVELSVHVPNGPRSPNCQTPFDALMRLPSAADATWRDGPTVEVEDQPPFYLFARNPVRLRLLESALP